MNKFRLSPKQNVYVTIACLVLILASQTYVLTDYFRTARVALEKESDAVLEDVFRRELNIRHKKYRQVNKESYVKATPVKEDTNMTTYDCSKMSNYSNNSLGLVELLINVEVSKLFPINTMAMDSITALVLKERSIQSNYEIKYIDVSQKDSVQTKPFTFLISSKALKIDFCQKSALQLVLINPFVPLFQRMGVVLLVSILLSIICFIAIWFQFSTLIRQKQLVVFKNDFLTTIAHELKRPVASLAFNLDSLKMPSLSDKPEFREKLINRSLYATTELNATIQMIVALSKVEEGILKLQEESIDLKLLFEELKNRFMAQASKPVHIELQCADKDLLCRGDVQLLQQCFANLIDNAIKYSENEVLILISLQQSGSWVVVSIKDNGLGIPDEKLPLIFDKYARVHTSNTKVNGFGIGLNYVKTIVEKHQGEVKVSSVVGKGSEFKVMLPKTIDNG